MLRWRIAILVAIAIVINYLDRLTLPTALSDIQLQSGLTFTDQQKALLNTAFLATYGLMYIGGGRLLDVLGTRRGFGLVMIFWSLACASHGFATGLAMLVVCRLLLGLGEGGGFPAATRSVAEWFPVKERSIAMGMMNGGTGVGGMIALPLVLLIVKYVHWFGLESWRWVFFMTGGFGLLWTLWWFRDYYAPERHPHLTAREKEYIEQGLPPAKASEPAIPIATLFKLRETWGIVAGKFLTDAAWYYILFWLPSYLRGEPWKLNIDKTIEIAWIPHAGTFVGCMVGGSLSSWLLRRKMSVNASRKIALFASAALMPALIFVPYMHQVGWVIMLFTIGYFGQQSWSTLVMVLPTDLFPKRAVGTVAGLVGMGGALGGIVLGQLASYLTQHGSDYKVIMLIAGLLHLSAFGVISILVPTIRPLEIPPIPASVFERARDRFELALKVQLPMSLLMLLGLSVVLGIMHPDNYPMMIMAGAGSFVVFLLLLIASHRAPIPCAIISMLLAAGALALNAFFLWNPERWGSDQAFAGWGVVISSMGNLILLFSALILLTRSPSPAPQLEAKVTA